VHSATTRLTVVGVIHKLTVDEFVDHTNTPTTCCGEIKTRVPGLSCGFVCVILCLAVLAEHRLVTDTDTDTDGHRVIEYTALA